MRYWIFGFLLTLPAASQMKPLVVDGNLSDPIWTEVTPAELVPSEQGMPTASGGEIRALVAGRYLYISGRLPEPSGHFVARLTGRNPNWEEEDTLRILAGSNIGYTDRIVQVNPLGAYSIEKAVHVSYRNQSIFPYADEWERSVLDRDANKFLVATSRSATEWDVEVAIPLNQLSAPGSDLTYVRVERIRATRPGSPRERWHWPKYGPAAKIPITKSVKWDAPAPALRAAIVGNQEPAIEVGRRASLPQLDSLWNDPVWTDVPTLSLLRDEQNAREPRFPTFVKLLQDGHTLAVIAKCAEPDRIVARTKENDGPVTQDDSFQVYLSSSGSSYSEFAVNAAGYLLDTMGFAGGPRLSRARQWTSGARVAVHRAEGSWQARIDIPLEPVASALGETSMPPEWRILLMRFRPARDGEPRESSVLPVTESDTGLCPARYRRLTLVDRDPSASKEIVSRRASTEFETRVLSPSERKQFNLAAMLEQQIRARVLKVLESEKHDRDQLQTQEDWERFRDPRIHALADSIGRFPQRTALETRVIKTFAGEGYQRQDLAYQSRPGLWVTANLYLPADPKTPMPGIVVVHSLHRPKSQAELQDMGILWARSGCAVLIMDQIGHGERIETYPWNREAYHSRYVTGMQLSLVGESLMKWMVWDIMRGLDLLIGRSDVNEEQIILMGAVAGGGDPAAVTAALDHRIAAVVPFNFGEATPEQGGGQSLWPKGMADPGWGSWESTRNLPGSIAHQFFPWIIDASVAPRRFLYSYELGWDVANQPAWERYQKVFGFYKAIDDLGEAHGFGAFPGPGECANIGPSQRQSIYPYLKRWFNIPAPVQEPDDRRPESELQCLTPGIASELKMQTIHHLAGVMAASELHDARFEMKNMSPQDRRRWLQRKLAAKLGGIEPNPSPQATSHRKETWRNATVEALTLEVEPGIIVPMLFIRSSRATAARRPIVIGVAEGGKERFMNERTEEIEALVNAGIEVCLPDVRGTGETSPDSNRNPSSEEISLAATEEMLDETLLGKRLKDLRTVIAYLETRRDIDATRLALWGESFAPVNQSSLMVDEMPGWRIGPTIQHQAEPLGGLLSILGALYEDRVRAVFVRGGLVSCASILDDAFSYVPGDVIVPGILEVGDLPDVMAAIAPRPLLLRDVIDGKNRSLPATPLSSSLALVINAYRASPGRLEIQGGGISGDPSEWLRKQLSETPDGSGNETKPK
ncbi:MAG: acetylxylan esterase [Bryobacteraceae bacterium]